MAQRTAGRHRWRLVAWAAALMALLGGTSATALSFRSPGLIALVRDSEDLAVVRTLELSRRQEPFAPYSSGGFETLTPVELVRSAGPHGAVPTEGRAVSTFNPEMTLIASRYSDGAWSLHDAIAAGGRAWVPMRDFSPNDFAEAVFALRLVLDVSDDHVLRERIVGMLQAKNVLLRGVALDLLQEESRLLDERLYARVAATVTCNDPLVLGALSILTRSHHSTMMPALSRLLQCADENLARTAHQTMQRACPINFRRARAPATRKTELAHFAWCWQEKDAEQLAVNLAHALKSRDAIERSEALRGLARLEDVDREAIFQGLRRAFVCGDPLTPEVVVQLGRFPFERSLGLLRSNLFMCDDSATRRAIHGVLVRHCPLDVERIQAKETRRSEYDRYAACIATKGIREKR